jgi:hypothetical protein
MPSGHSCTPVSDSAGWILLGDKKKLALSFVVPEGVKQGDAASEGVLHLGLAGVLKVHGSQLRGCDAGFMVFVLRNGHKTRSEEENESDDETEVSHLNSPTFCGRLYCEIAN